MSYHTTQFLFYFEWINYRKAIYWNGFCGFCHFCNNLWNCHLLSMWFIAFALLDLPASVLIALPLGLPEKSESKTKRLRIAFALFFTQSSFFTVSSLSSLHFARTESQISPPKSSFFPRLDNRRRFLFIPSLGYSSPNIALVS